MDTVKFIEAVKELADAKGIGQDAIVSALEEAIIKAYLKYLGGGDDANVYCHIIVDENNGRIELGQIKKVVEEVEDDYLEISVEDANEGKKKAKYKAGDDYVIPATVEELSKATAMAVKSNLRQRIAEAERSALYEIYKDYIGTMMTGTVEKADDRSVTVNIGRASVELNRRELIGDEYFKVGDTIKVYIQEVKTADASDVPGKKRGPQIEATRSSEGFLKRLFEEEIHEIFDGTVIIKAIARQAGVRSKVAVYSNNEDVDPTGACIGQGGSRIQKVVSQLGNGHNKEKIDIINYSDYAPLFIIESVRPAQALGVWVSEEGAENKEAKVIVDKEKFTLAVGKYHSNQNLASRLTGYKVEFLTPEDAAASGLTFIDKETAQGEADAMRRLKERQEFARKSAEEAARREAEARAKAAAEEAARKAAEEAAAKAAAAKAAAAKPASKAEPLPEMPKVAPKASADPTQFPADAMNPAAAALAALSAAKAEAAAAAEANENAAEETSAETPVEETPAVEPVEVKTTTSLSDLEKELEGTQEKKEKRGQNKRPHKITDGEVKHEPAPAPKATANENAIPVYTEDELNEIEAEENSLYEDDLDGDEDYSDYDDEGDNY